MQSIREQSKDWIKNFYNWYNKSQNILFEAFITYYGESERETIIEEIANVPFLFILSDVSYLNCKNIPKDYFPQKLVSYFKRNKLILNNMVRHRASDSTILNEAVKQSMITKYPRTSLEYYLHKDYIADPSAATTHFDIDGTNPIIILPIFFINDGIIFHELNHVLTTPKRIGKLFPSEEVDEIINELISQDVLKIFKELGGEIFPYKLDLGNGYKEDLFFMISFYKKFKTLIKKCVRNSDLRVLENNLGKENLRLYFALVKKLCNTKYITDIDLKRINFLINQMEQYYKSKKECYNKIRLRKLEK